MKRYPKILSVYLLLMFFFITLTAVAFAQQSEVAVITKNNVKDMLEKANKGDQAALKALSKFSIFDPKKVAEKVNGVRVYAGQTKTVDFGDGSAITLDYQITSGGTQIPAYYTWEGDYVHAIAMHKWFLLGVEVGRYELHFIYDPNGNNPILKEKWDIGSAIYGNQVNPLGTDVLTDVGPYAVGVTGRGIWSTNMGASQTVKINAYGYFDPSLNWAEEWIYY
ncbi:hypothetical protein MHOCP_06620 [Moorella humiferrea]|uniref:hypothetical protein n=1 Tax=Neomoorella humiferrea TaxID=676965 RepID=UPI0030D2F05D